MLMRKTLAFVIATTAILALTGCGGGGSFHFPGSDGQSDQSASLTVTVDFGDKSRAVPAGTTRVHIQFLDPATNQPLTVTYQGTPLSTGFNLTPEAPSITVEGVRIGDVRIKGDAYGADDSLLSSDTSMVSVGEGSNQVSLHSRSFTLSVTPQGTTLFTGERLNLVANVTSGEQEPFTVSYHWVRTGSAGSLATGDDQETENATVEYDAANEGQDTVAVSATVTFNGETVTLAPVTVNLVVTRNGTFTLCGADGQGFGVDDDLTVKVGDITIYHDTDGVFAGMRGPFTFDSQIGATVSLSLLDYYGGSTGIDDIYVKYPDGRKKLLFTHWQHITDGVRQTVWEGTATIPPPDPVQ